MKALLPIGMACLLAGCALVRQSAPVHTRSDIPRRETAEPAPRSPMLIRVAILTRQRELRLQAPGNFSLTGFSLTPDELSSRAVTLTVERLSAPKARLQTHGTEGLKVNGQTYMGALEIYPDHGGTLTVVNELGLEDYVMGVLLGEVPKDWPLEALKAQALAARTFAVTKRAESRAAHRPWDLENHALFQVYRGSVGVCDNIRRAVLSNQGQVLTWEGKPIWAFYHSNCGGETCPASEVWGTDLPYLKAVDCKYCRTGPHYRWTTVVSTTEVSRRLRDAGFWVGDVARIEPLEKDESGRVREVQVTDTEGRSKILKGNAFRNALGADTLRCTRFDVDLVSEGFRFQGKGWGHGVGMCQEGAYGMAMAGYRASEIIRKYYPGVLIEKMKEE